MIMGHRDPHDLCNLPINANYSNLFVMKLFIPIASGLDIARSDTT